MKIILFLLGLSALSEAALLGAKECTYGPAYWCENIKQAKQCQAVTHCIQSVWEKTILPEDNDDVCAICKEMVTEARDQLQSNETQEDIRRVFVGACKLIPIKIVQHECIKFSDEFIPELIETLASQMNPQIVCATAGLCNSPKIDKLLKKYKLEHVQPSKSSNVVTKQKGDCTVCVDFVDRFIQDVKSHEPNNFLDHLLAVCGRLSSLSEGCRMLIETQFRSIYSFVTQELNSKEACQLFGMCPRMFGDSVTALKKTGDEPCDFCVAIVTNWRTSLVSNTTKEEFRMILNGLCHQTGTFEKECLSLVDQYFEVIYEILVSEIDPKEICSAVGLCGANSIFKVDPPIWSSLGPLPGDMLPLVPLGPSLNRKGFTGMDEANSYRHAAALPRIPLSKASVGVVSLGETGVINKEEKSPGAVGGKNVCVMCELVLHYLQTVLQDKMTKKEIQDELDMICTKFPKSIVEECQDYVDAYSDMVVELLIQDMDPSVICPEIHLCPKKKLELTDKPTCVLCEFVMVKVDEMLKENSTKQDIHDIVGQVCGLMPKDIRSECNTFVDTYMDQLIDLLEQYSPKQVCQIMGLCSSTKNDDLVVPVLEPVDAQLPVSRYFVPFMMQPDLPAAEPTKPKQSKFCVLCEFIVAQIDSQLLKNSTEEDVKRVVEKVCTILPSTLKTDCLGFLEQYADSLIQLLVQNLKPEEVCTELHLCHDNLFAGLPRAVVHVPMDDCEICEEVLDYLSANSAQFASQSPVEILLPVCNQMSPSESDVCSRMVLKNGGFLFPLYQALLNDATAVCQSIKMCPLKVKRQLVGSDECTFGPSFWCATRANARKCKQRKYCRQNVWNKEERLGEDQCTQGPAFWCQSLNNAKKCKNLQYCVDNEWTEQPPLVGANPCTWGPAYWCESLENARTCSALDHCSSRVWNGPEPPKPGQEVCSRGPGYWCASLENAKECKNVHYCFDNEWQN